MSKQKTGFSVDAYRYFRCKKCAETVKEPLRSWQRKKQKDKNICQDCLKRREIARQDQQERARDMPYSTFRLY